MRSYFWLLALVAVGMMSCERPSDKGQNTEVKVTAKDFPPSPHDRELGLPSLDVPEDNPITKEKVALGDKLFHDVRFSSSGTISCATCHAAATGFTDSPLKVSKGIEDLTGTRNAPTVINAAFFKSQFWDGRSPSLEDQALHPFTNPVEMGLKDHNPIIEVVKNDPEYTKAFKEVFNTGPEEITIEEITKAIATFERTVIAGNSRFDRWYYQGEPVMTEQEIRGFEVFNGNGRCVSCHQVEETSALFTDHKFHNIGVGINRLKEEDLLRIASEFQNANYNNAEVDEKVLNDPLASELGRFAVAKDLTTLGAFKTSTLRNIALTAPYMHDGSLATLKEVVEHYNRGGASSDEEKINPYLSGGIRPLELTDQEIDDLVAFMEALTSQEFVSKEEAK